MHDILKVHLHELIMVNFKLIPRLILLFFIYFSQLFIFK